MHASCAPPWYVGATVPGGAPGGTIGGGDATVVERVATMGDQATVVENVGAMMAGIAAEGEGS